MKQQENEENAKNKHENFQALLGPKSKGQCSANSSPLLISHESAEGDKISWLGRENMIEFPCCRGNATICFPRSFLVHFITCSLVSHGPDKLAKLGLAFVFCRNARSQVSWMCWFLMTVVKSTWSETWGSQRTRAMCCKVTLFSLLKGCSLPLWLQTL